MKNTDEKNQTGKSDPAMNLAANLLRDQDNLDFGSILKMANTLLKDDKLMGMVEEIGKSENQPNSPQSPSINGMNDLSILQTQINDLRKEIGQIKKDVAELRKQDSSILNLGKKVVNSTGRDLLKGFILLTGVKGLLK